MHRKLFFSFILTGWVASVEAETEIWLKSSLEYLTTLVQVPEKADYKDTYLLLPVIMRHYHREFSVNDSILNTVFTLEHKMFCLNQDCFNGFKPDKIFFKNISRRWKNEPDNIDVRMDIATHYASLKNPPVLDELFAYKNMNLYELTHAGIFLHIIEQQIGEREEVLYWKKNILDEIHEVINSRSWMFMPQYRNVNLDILLECFLVVALLDTLSENHLNEMLSHQLSDGSYALSQNSCQGSTHSSLIAIWVLLAHTQGKI